jgi:transcriptional regulator with GAF, ATPase, and Fis domain
MRPRSLKNALLLTVAALVTVSGLIISQIVTHRYGASLLQCAAARAENIAHSLSLNATDAILINDRVALQKLLDDQIVSTPEVAYIFVVQNGDIISHTFSGGMPVGLIDANRPDDPESGRLEKLVSTEGEHFLDIAWPIFGGKAGVIRLGVSEASYRAEVDRLWWRINSMTMAVLLLALLVSHWLIHRLTRPLVQLAAAAESIDEDHLDTGIQVRGRSEVMKVTASFNKMIARLRDYTKALQENNRRLETQHGELERAHQRLTTALSISREISALPNFNDVAVYLVRSLKNVVQCRNLALMAFNGKAEEGLVSDGKAATPVVLDAISAIIGKMNDRSEVGFFRQSDFSGFRLPDDIVKCQKIGILPFQHHGQTTGALIIGCPVSCHCVTRNMEAVTLILQQTAGVIHRSFRQEMEVRNLKGRVDARSGFDDLVGKDPKIQVVYKLIEDVAPTDATVLIQGESGTGKELAARAIHRTSHRGRNPFVVINCSAYPATLLESELFGHEKGAFTGALRGKKGRFEQADGGTVFLDEIGEISASAQIKLLRVLQTRRFERLGGEDALQVDVRILAATNKDLLREVQAGRFREDLYYRLHVVPIHLPPLRERGNDIPLLARFFMDRFASEQGKAVDRIDSETMRKLMAYPWPGNVRELENSIEHAVVLAKSDRIAVSDLPPGIAHPVENDAATPKQTITENEAQLVREALESSNWNKTRAAARLGISRSTLYEKLKKYQIRKPTLH